MTLHATPEELIEIKATFVQALRECGNFETSAVVRRRRARQERRYEDADPDFAEAIRDAHAEYWSLFRHHVAERLQFGVVEPVYQTGRIVGYIRRYKDSTALGMLTRYDPLIADRPQRVVHEMNKPGDDDEIDFSNFDSDDEIELFLRMNRKVRGQPEVEPTDAEPEEVEPEPEAEEDESEEEA